jgi:hemolysin D
VKEAPVPPQTPPHPAKELLHRYRAIWQAAWAARHEMVGPKLLADQTAFLPAALSLQETPLHPAPRRTAWVLCALFLIALLWSIFGKIDIVAVAHGRIIVSERSKTVQPLEAGVIRQVHVKDGDQVVAGQVLIELDPTNASADSASVAEQLAAAQSELQRTTALLEALRHNKPPVLRPPTPSPLPSPTSGRGSLNSLSPVPGGEDGGEGAARSTQAIQAQLQTEWQDITAKLAKLSSEQARRQAEMLTVNATIDKLEATLPLARQRELDVKGLAEQGFMSSHLAQDRTRERIELERDLTTQRARKQEAQAAAFEATQAQAAYRAETQRLLSERQAQAHTKQEQLGQEQNKAQARTRLTQLTAPTSGTVQQLAVHTTGGVVTPAQVLMVIVPKDAEVTAEVVVDNKDIGFVQAGQTSTIKLETFPFTRYGTVDAQVKTVAADAVNDEKRGAIFPALLTLKSSTLSVDGKRVNLAPGMNLSAEIKTGQRRIISYLFNPVQKALDESLGER